MLIFTQMSLRLAPDGPIENKASIMQAIGSMPEADMRQEGFLLQRFFNPALGLRHG